MTVRNPIGCSSAPGIRSPCFMYGTIPQSLRNSHQGSNLMFVLIEFVTSAMASISFVKVGDILSPPCLMRYYFLGYIFNMIEDTGICVVLSVIILRRNVLEMRPYNSKVTLRPCASRSVYLFVKWSWKWMEMKMKWFRQQTLKLTQRCGNCCKWKANI